MVVALDLSSLGMYWTSIYSFPEGGNWSVWLGSYWYNYIHSVSCAADWGRLQNNHLNLVFIGAEIYLVFQKSLARTVNRQ